jgi:hypothetical protein
MSAQTQSRVESTRLLAERLDAEAKSLETKAGIRVGVYLAIGVVFIAYTAFAFQRIGSFVEPGALAKTTGDIAIGHALQFIETEKQQFHILAPSVVTQAEAAALDVIPRFRGELQRSLETELKDSVNASIAASDDALVLSLKSIPNSARLVQEAAKNPRAMATLFDQARRHSATVPEEATQLREVRSHLHKLRVAKNLTPAERTERRLVQVVLARLDTPKVGALEVKPGR